MSVIRQIKQRKPNLGFFAVFLVVAIFSFSRLWSYMPWQKNTTVKGVNIAEACWTAPGSACTSNPSACVDCANCSCAGGGGGGDCEGDCGCTGSGCL